jgi:hypothetical protein
MRKSVSATLFALSHGQTPPKREKRESALIFGAYGDHEPRQPQTQPQGLWGLRFYNPKPKRNPKQGQSQLASSLRCPAWPMQPSLTRAGVGAVPRSVGHQWCHTWSLLPEVRAPAGVPRCCGNSSRFDLCCTRERKAACGTAAGAGTGRVQAHQPGHPCLPLLHAPQVQAAHRL